MGSQYQLQGQQGSLVVQGAGGHSQCRLHGLAVCIGTSSAPDNVHMQLQKTVDSGLFAELAVCIGGLAI